MVVWWIISSFCYIQETVRGSVDSCDVGFVVGENMHSCKTILDMNQTTSRIFLSLFLMICSLSVTRCLVIPLNGANIESVLHDYEVVFVNFYADWCRFSQHLMPIFEEASKRFTDRGNTVAWATVDCDREADIAQKYHVSKYPTLKLFRGGELVKKEYRGQRSVDALAVFIDKQLVSGMQNFSSNAELNNQINPKKLNIVAYFDQPSGPEFDNYRKVASLLRDDCVFWFGIGEAFRPELAKGNRLEFRPLNSNERIEYTGGLANLETLKQWIMDKCVPLVREITFENAEELTEEGLPFLILFRHPDDVQIDKIFTEQVARELFDQKSSINCLYADGKKFVHPLQHLGKTMEDLPVLAIDSFRHMYLFPDMKSLTVPGKLRQFVLDLHSGKLHREFHHSPDPTQSSVLPASSETTFEKETKGTDKSQPPTSIFKQLKPSETRYSLLYKDEL
ncbi:Thioredoxin family protein [Brugia malayi]|uniref:Bm9680 n=2 Tax=Brugia malayi TaxID=6279 RepID=A0A0K0K040_BRUMA|nr:Thioredoxin family protein [Brugia malayi]CDP95094.1 Bm9680 [Brugia malayi]VIO95343.1 Thioredoxin family protein [Brugia malayi]